MACLRFTDWATRQDMICLEGGKKVGSLLPAVSPNPHSFLSPNPLISLVSPNPSTSSSRSHSASSGSRAPPRRQAAHRTSPAASSGEQPVAPLAGLLHMPAASPSEQQKDAMGRALDERELHGEQRPLHLVAGAAAPEGENPSAPPPTPERPSSSPSSSAPSRLRGRHRHHHRLFSPSSPFSIEHGVPIALGFSILAGHEKDEQAADGGLLQGAVARCSAARGTGGRDQEGEPGCRRKRRRQKVRARRRGGGREREGDVKKKCPTEEEKRYLAVCPSLTSLRLAGCYSKMVCMAGHLKMACVLKLVMVENHAAPDEVNNEKSASHILQKQLLGAHEPSLLDEDGTFFPFLEPADRRLMHSF